jgi:hypothetical protein
VRKLLALVLLAVLAVGGGRKWKEVRRARHDTRADERERIMLSPRPHTQTHHSPRLESSARVNFLETANEERMCGRADEQSIYRACGCCRGSVGLPPSPICTAPAKAAFAQPLAASLRHARPLHSSSLPVQSHATRFLLFPRLLFVATLHSTRRSTCTTLRGLLSTRSPLL